VGGRGGGGGWCMRMGWIWMGRGRSIRTIDGFSFFLSLTLFVVVGYLSYLGRTK
jgi:hypothetical protein